MRPLTPRGAALLETVHAHPGMTRADAARELGIGTGAATELVARLVDARLLAETPAAPTGGRGRPTTLLGPHPDGPLVLAASVTHESWQLEAVSITGDAVGSAHGQTSGATPDELLGAIAKASARLRRRFPGRVRGIGLSVPGTVIEGHVLDSVNLGWQGVDVRAVWPKAPLFAAGNDATLAALAEARRGAATHAHFALHLLIDAGLGGGVIEDGRLVEGARGVAGEFGHMPFGDPAVVCPCGARGCWGTAVDGGALARILGDQPGEGDSVSYARKVLAAAAAGDARAAGALASVAATFGRGMAGLVNALDPDLVTLGGLAADLLAHAPTELRAAFTAGLMEFRRSTPPPVIPALLGDAGPLIGASEQVWTQLWPRLEA